MSVKRVQLPLIPGDLPTTDVAAREGVLAFGAVVVQHGDELLLVDTSAITAQAVGGGNATVWEVGGQSLPLVTIEDAAAAEQDSAPAAAFFTLNPHGALLASPMTTSATDAPSVVVSYLETDANFHLGQRVYRCTAFNEAYNESTYFRLGGVCPAHGAPLR